MDHPVQQENEVVDQRDKVRKGRGSASNLPSRFLKTTTVEEADGWADTGEPAAARVATQVFADATRRLITRNRSPDLPFDQSINPYKGCEHGCIYCFARPTHTYLDLSAGLDFESKIFVKSDPRLHLEAELGSRGYACRTIAMGTNTDPYQPLEKTRRVTREILTVLLEARHPVSLVTKSGLILRDLYLLSDLAKLSLVCVNVSVTTLDNTLKTKLEPRTASPAARLKTIRELRKAGIPTGAMIAPVIPFINDHELEALVDACAAAGAQALRYILLRLPLEVKPLFEEWLENHYPLKAQRVMAAVRDTRGGKAYDARWHQRMVGQGELAGLIGKRFDRALKRHGLDDASLPPLRTDLFLPPRSSSSGQLDLFG